MGFFQFILITPINFIQFVIFLSVIMSWLVAFNIVNPANRFVGVIFESTRALTEPILRPVRQRLPDLGGIDISPILVLFGLEALKIFLRQFIF